MKKGFNKDVPIAVGFFGSMGSGKTTCAASCIWSDLPERYRAKIENEAERIGLDPIGSRTLVVRRIGAEREECHKITWSQVQHEILLPSGKKMPLISSPSFSRSIRNFTKALSLVDVPIVCFPVNFNEDDVCETRNILRVMAAFDKGSSMMVLCVTKMDLQEFSADAFKAARDKFLSILAGVWFEPKNKGNFDKSPPSKNFTYFVSTRQRCWNGKQRTAVDALWLFETYEGEYAQRLAYQNRKTDELAQSCKHRTFEGHGRKQMLGDDAMAKRESFRCFGKLASTRACRSKRTSSCHSLMLV